MTGELTRRRFVALAGASALAASAGCSASPGESDAAAQANATTTTLSAESLDLREANVVGVEHEGDGDAYQFSVTLFHDDEGEQGYAYWWQVETLSGDRLGRRDLLHAHGTERFTRSENVEIPAGTRYVVVRGHDETHGYGGRAVVVDLDEGTTEGLRQGPEPRTFENYTATVTEQ
jgi:hypothetical protein